MYIYTLKPEDQEIFESLKTIKLDQSTLEPLITGPLYGELSAHYGCRHSEETKLLMSKQKLGSNNPNFGGITEEHKQNISKGLTGYQHSESAKESYRLAQSNPEHRKTQSIKMKDYLSNPENMKQRVDQITLLNKDPENRKRKSLNMSAKRWYNNGIRNIRIEPENVPEGFVLGKLKSCL